MKNYRLYYSNESDALEVYKVLKFLRKNQIQCIGQYSFIKGSDAIAQMSRFNSEFFNQLAEQNVSLPLKLRYVFLVVENPEDFRDVQFIKGGDNIITYLSNNLL